MPSGKASGRLAVALAGAGFRRYATYRQATVAGAFANVVFGFLRSYVLLSVAGAGLAAGYDRAQLATFVWVGPGAARGGQLLGCDGPRRSGSAPERSWPSCCGRST